MTKKIILGTTTLEDRSYIIEKLGAALSAKLDTRYALMHVDETLHNILNNAFLEAKESLPADFIKPLSEETEKNRQSLVEHLTQIVKMSGLEPEVILEYGDPVEKILEKAEKLGEQIKMLVLGKRHRSFIDQFFLGSVARKIVEKTKVPTLVIPQDERFNNLVFEQITVATSLKEGSLQAEKLAAEICRACGATLELLHIQEEIPREWIAPSLTGNVEFQNWEQKFGLGEEQILTRLENRKALLDLPPEMITITLKHGPTTDTLARHMHNTKADLLILGSHSTPGLKRFFLGSTTSDLVRLSRFPILVVHHDDFAMKS